MSRKWSKAIPEGNDPVPHQEEIGPDQPTLADVYRLFEERFDRQLKLMKSHFDQLDELMEKTRETNRSLAGLEQEARQPRLATKADVPADTKTRKRMDDAAAVQAKHGDRFSARRVQAGRISSTSFGIKAEPPALSRRNDVLVDKGAAAPKQCVSPVEMRTLTTPDDLLTAGKAFTAKRIIFYQLPLRFCPTEETSSGTTSAQYTTYSDFWKMKVLETRPWQTLVFDFGGSTGRLRACPFLETWRGLFCGEVFVWAPDGTQSCSAFGGWMTRNVIFRERYKRIVYAVRVAINCYFSAARLV